MAKKKGKRARRRDYKKEYRRRLERAEALGYSKSVARGHPRKDKGEVGRAELAKLRRAAKILSPGQQRAAGVRRPVTAHIRREAWGRIAELAGLDEAGIPKSTERTRRTSDADRFADQFVEMGLGSRQEAFTLYFSP